MKYTFAFLLVFCLYGSLNAQLIDKIVAQVGDEIILLSNVQAAKLQQVQERNLDVKDISTLSDCKIKSLIVCSLK